MIIILIILTIINMTITITIMVITLVQTLNIRAITAAMVIIIKKTNYINLIYKFKHSLRNFGTTL